MSGVSIKDKRRLPFFMVTKAATAAIRSQFDSRRGQTALAVYIAIVECSNDARSDSFSRPRPEIAKRAMVNIRALDAYVCALEAIGLLHVERRPGHPNLWTLTDPPMAAQVVHSDCTTSTNGVVHPDDTTPVQSGDTGGVHPDDTPRNQEEKTTVEAPQPPASGGRRRDRDRYDEELRRWIGENLPQLPEHAHGYVRSAIGEGRRTLPEIRAYVDRWAPAGAAA